MTFKITAAEKKEILKRRKKIHGQDGYSENEVRNICKRFTSNLETSSDYDDLEELATSLSEGETSLQLPLKKAVQIAYNLQMELTDVLDDIASKSERKYGKVGNKLIIKLGW